MEEEKMDLKQGMQDFALRVLRGGKDVQPQETAILPYILKYLLEQE